MSVFKELNARGIFAQATHPQQIEELIDSGKAVFYIGFDPTADSLHAGSFVQLMAMAHLQRAGNRPIVLLGGGTGMVGDPSGKTDMRKLMDAEIISHNVDCFRKQMSRFLDFGDGNSAPDGKAFFVNNADWLMELKYVDVLREIGAHMSVNKMLTAECFKQRLERGLSFLEFNYMLMQSYDFWELNRRYGCTLQCGGNDQWSNIISGVDLIRRKEQKEAFGLTFNLLLTSDGRKMGKTESGSVWLDADKTSPYDFFQYWRNIDDGDVINCIKMLTFIPLDEIKKYEALEGSALNKVKERLAFEVTQLVHGETEADKALKSATAVFTSGIANDDMPTTTISEQDFTDGKITVIELLVKSELCSSKADARRLIDGGGISIEFIQNGKKSEKKPEGIASALTVGDFESGGGFIILRKGKKVFHKILKSQ